MSKYEHLFSKDPIGAFEKIEDDYLRYFKAAYKLANTELDKNRINTLASQDNMSKEAYLEVLPEYKTINDVHTIDDLAEKFANSFGSKEIAKKYFANFIAKGLMRGLMTKFLPYGHQIGMMRKAFAGIGDNGNSLPYKNTVITSGTGSGKTESFLLPLLADIYKEAITENWPTAADHNNWYTGTRSEKQKLPRYKPCQREGDARPAAIRALVLYPMNALVEDQMGRLREALDSDEIRSFMDRELLGNRIYFGSYNGATIAQKSYDILVNNLEDTPLVDKMIDMAQKLSKIHNNYEFARRHVANHPDQKDALYISPRLGGVNVTSEMITRWDMQYWSPDILITNTSMLSIMLMRKAEERMFEDTRRWLAAEDKPEQERQATKENRIFHIVVDELHLYRGTSGSEVACLLRMLYKALDLDPVIDDGQGNKIPNPQLKVLASSASLGDETATQKFMEEFFGIYSTKDEYVFNIQPGSNYYGTDSSIDIDYTKFAAFTPDNFAVLDVDANPPVNESETAQKKLNFANQFLTDNFNSTDILSFVSTYQEQIFADFYNALPSNSDNSKRPIAQSALQHQLFGDNKEALRGFLIFRAFIDTLNENGTPKQSDNEKSLAHKLPRFRFHKFFKYVEGMWGELQPSLNGNAPISYIDYTANEVGPNKRKVLELLRCENCGELFIGGNKKDNDGRNGTVSLTLNYPNLDQIPNFNPTPMVQNKNYRDYAIFWPHNLSDAPTLTSGDVKKGSNDHVVEISSGKPSTQTGNINGRATWIPGYIDAVTGKFTPQKLAEDMITHQPNLTILNNGIPGFLYRVVGYKTTEEINEDQAKKIYAAPCTCPHCLQDYTTRKYTNSPIRSFRTGIDRSNQILSKELLYQLDEKSSKLIGFSDSREDAAKQALGIEKEQYRDMVRMLFVESVNEIGNEVFLIDSFVKQEIAKCGTNFEQRFQIPNKAQEQFPNIANATNIACQILAGNTAQSLVPDTISLNKLVGYNFDGIIVQKLLRLGINPAGEAHKYQWYVSSNAGNPIHHWSNAYDFSRHIRRTNPDYNEPTMETQIRKQLKNAIFANSFGKYMGVSILDSGIGYIGCKHSTEIENSTEYNNLDSILPQGIKVYDFVDAFIRVMGDNYLYPSNEDGGDDATSFGELKAAVRRPIEHFCEKYRLDIEVVGKYLVAFLRKNCTSPMGDLSLELDLLTFTKMTEPQYIRCPKCGRVHPNMGFGFCTNTCCMSDLDPNEKVLTSDLHKHYISFDILEEKKDPRRLHTEELSGQTDDIQSRLHEFKDLILVDDQDPTYEGQKATKPIDMVCVTTTMEVGVDIGSLQAIFQGNMPPTRYNYQQRVGRGGRRGQAFSTAFTFCRGRSHDIYYYSKAIDEIVGGIPATPTLSLAPYIESDGTVKMKTAIMKRVVVKELLHQAYKDLPYRFNLQDTSGEFGTIDDWKTPNAEGVSTKDILSNWVADNANEIEGTVHRYFDQFNIGNQIEADINNVIDWIKNSMVSQIDNAVKKTSVYDMGLAQYLTETGFLPMYGMPSDSRYFYHGYDIEHKKVRRIDRSSEMAISEFAPGAEKTKDKARYRVEGLTVSINEDADSAEKIAFFDNRADALEDRYVLTYEKTIAEDNIGNNISDIDYFERHADGQDETPDAIEDNNTLPDNAKILVIPQAYRSLEIEHNTGTPVENNDKGNSFIQCQIFAKDNDTNGKNPNHKDVGNVRISLYELGLNEDPTIWHVNDNNGSFYSGAYQDKNMDIPCSNKGNFMFYDKVTTNKVRRKDPSNDKNIDIAIGSKKVTEMVKLELLSCPDSLNLSLEKGNRSAIRAAFYSAAFLLQRALADTLDVQPDEIEICEKIDNKHEYPVIYLSDALANGAGIVSYLYKEGKLNELITNIVNFDTFDKSKTKKEDCFMQSLISDEHKKNCLTACQKCLLAYNNRGFHHVLDWRMGVGILRLMLGREYDFGFEPNNRSKYEELKDLDHLFAVCADKMHIQIGQYNYKIATDPRTGQNTYKIIYHPLWRQSKVLQEIEGATTGNSEMYNIFKVLRSDLTKDTIYEDVNTNEESTTSSPTINDPSVKNNTASEEKSVVDTPQTKDSTYGITKGVILA